MSVDIDGQIEYSTLKRFEVKGSFDTKSYVRCDGYKVEYAGNPSHFNRSDNVFGYCFSDCLLIVNQILSMFGLPPFTAGRPFETNDSKGHSKVIWTGASISRVDITRNYCTGSKENAYHFMQFLATQKLKSKYTKAYGDFETIEYAGKSKTREYFKMYDKAKELLNNYKYKKDQIESDSFQRQNPNFNLQKLVYLCESNGIVRAEMELKGKKLQDMRCYYLGEFNMNIIHAEFKKHTAVFERAECDVDELTFESKSVLSVYRMWQAGDDLRIKMKKSQLYKYRSELLKFGIDIFIPNNIYQYKPKTRIIALSAAVKPDWYSMPDVELKAA
jgi:II/X family phage/plasmid replication protein